MFLKMLLSLSLFSMLFFQDQQLQRQVMRKHSNGKPYVVLYFSAASQKLVKEEVFFSNGNPQWSGNYKNEVEDGPWKYYYENGKLKSEQHYVKGKEEGLFTDYDEQGKVVKQGTYKAGRLIEEKRF
jgi:antitoxin component YwqK of YwqJK toxin-antitoxin module